MRKLKQMVSFVLSGRIKKIYFTCFILLVLCNCNYSVAQNNLVPNYSFEILDTCPWQFGQLFFANPWFQPNINGCSTDLWHSCSDGVSTPWNMAGFQYPRTGGGYAGIGIIQWPNDTFPREYLEVQLLDTLIYQKKYCVSFYVSFAGGQPSISTDNLATSAIGAYFSSDSLIDYSFYCTIHVTPQIANPYNNILADTVNWMLISGVLIAEGGEQFITIGNFWDQPYVNDSCVGTPCGGSYYYIDDVSVVKLPEIDAGNNDTICRGDSVFLMGYISEQWMGMQYLWQPQNGINNPNALQTYASPDSTTTYYLSVSYPTCDVPCLDSIIDSVTIYVIQPSLSIDAGNDTIIAQGDSVQIGSLAQGGLTYQWQPSTGLDNPNIAQPWASPLQSTTYILTSTLNENGCSFILQDSVTVDVSVGINEFIFNGFDLLYPNPANDMINIECALKNAELLIMDIWGNVKIKKQTNGNYTHIDISGLEKGVYFIKIVSEKGIVVKKFVKE